MPEANLTFGQAIEALKNGNAVARTGWNGKGMWLILQRPDENSKMTLPYIFLNTPRKVSEGAPQYIDRVPWLASQTDMLSEDWYIITAWQAGSSN